MISTYAITDFRIKGFKESLSYHSNTRIHEEFSLFPLILESHNVLDDLSLFRVSHDRFSFLHTRFDRFLQDIIIYIVTVDE